MNLLRSARCARTDGDVRPRGVGLIVAAGVVLAVAASGCSTNQSVVASAQPRLSAAPAPTSAAPTSAATATVAATAALPPMPCRTSDLSVSPGSQSVRDGLNIAKFDLTDSGARACTISGSPQITPQGPLPGQSMTMEANLAVSQIPLSLPSGAKAAGPDGITLQPGKSAFFDLGWYSASPVVCEASDGFGFDAPADTASSDAFTVNFPIGSMCDGLFYASVVYSAT